MDNNNNNRNNRIMKIDETKYYLFGNMGAVWSKEAHIAESGSFSGTTLCGTPMLSSNHVRNHGVEEAQCGKCITIYKEANGN